MNFNSAVAHTEEKERAEERAKAEAGEKELAEKAYREKIESAKRMLKRGLSASDVADFSGLSSEEIEKLR